MIASKQQKHSMKNFSTLAAKKKATAGKQIMINHDQGDQVKSKYAYKMKQSGRQFEEEKYTPSPVLF